MVAPPAALEQALANVIRPTDPVNRLIASRVTAVLRKGGDFAKCTQGKLLPRIEALGHKITALTNLNRIVHTPIYNRIIRQAVADLRARDPMVV